MESSAHRDRGLADDAGNAEALTSAANAGVVGADIELRSATVDGSTLTLIYRATPTSSVTLSKSAFTVNVNGAEHTIFIVGLGGANVLLTLSTPVAAGDTVTVAYPKPSGANVIKDTDGNAAASFSGQAVTNNTPAAVQLTASVSAVPGSHDGSATFTFELQFSEEPEDDFSYTTMKDHAFTVTGGRVTKSNRLNPPSNIGWLVHITPDGDGTVTIVLPVTTDCVADVAICTEDGRMLSAELVRRAGDHRPGTGRVALGRNPPKGCRGAGEGGRRESLDGLPHWKGIGEEA